MRRRRLPFVAAAAAAILLVSGAPRADAAGPFPFPDLTPPTISVEAPPSPWEGWYADTIDLHVTLTDPGTNASGVLTGSWAMTGATIAQGQLPRTGSTHLTISAHGHTTVTLKASDAQGNKSERAYAVGIDRAAPTFSLTPDLSGNPVFVQGAPVDVTYGCDDIGTEVASCLGSVASGGRLPTSTVGANAFTMEVRDRVGNTTRQTFAYRVAAAPLAVVSAPTLQGDVRVGQTVAANDPVFAPVAERLSYRWTAGNEVVGTEATYTIRPEDLGDALRVEVTGHREGRAITPTTSAASTVAPGVMTGDGLVTVRGSLAVGRTVAAAVPMLVPGPSMTTFQWFRGGVPIAGAAGPQYLQTSADVGRRLSVRVVATRAGYSPRTIDSAQTAAVVKATPTVTARATARGKARVRVSVTVRAYGLTPGGQVTIMRGSKVVARHRALRGGRVDVDLSRQPRTRTRYTVAYGGSASVGGARATTSYLRVR